MESADVYEAHASHFLCVRDKSCIGKVVVEQWARSLGDGAVVMELGCGGDRPDLSVT